MAFSMVLDVSSLKKIGIEHFRSYISLTRLSGTFKFGNIEIGVIIKTEPFKLVLRG